MMGRLWKRFANLPLLVQIIFVFCVWGAVSNALAVWYDLLQNPILLRLHIGFLILYVGQVVFILLHERMVFMLALVQGLVALATNYDFTFVPVLQFLGEVVYRVRGGWSLEASEVYKYIFVSACFTLDLLKTALLFILITPLPTQPQVAEADTSSR